MRVYIFMNKINKWRISNLPFRPITVCKDGAVSLSLSCRRRRRRSWRSGLGDKRAQPGRNGATEPRDWLGDGARESEGGEREEGRTFAFRESESDFTSARKEEEEEFKNNISKSYFNKHIIPKQRWCFYLRWIMGNVVGFLWVFWNVGVWMKEVVTHCEYVQRSRQGSPMQWSHGSCGHVFIFFGSDFSFPITNYTKKNV